MKSEPSFQIDGVETGDALAPEVRDESDPMQIESTEVKYKPPNDTMEMEESEGLCLYSGPSASSEANKISDHKQNSACDVFLCDTCGYKTDTKMNLENHLRTHADLQPLVCASLEYESSSEHASTIPPTEHEKHIGQILMMCSLCDFIGREESEMRRHMNVHVKNETPNDHLQVQGSSVMVKRDIPHEPLQLGEVYSINDRLSVGSQPRETVIENAGMQCSEDDPLRLKVSGDYSQDAAPCGSSRPKEIPVPNKRFTCDVCGYKTNKKVTFEDHLRTHTGEKPFACDLCNYRSSSKHTLGKHKKIHTRPKPFKCDSCEYRGSTRSDLSRHMNTHLKGYSIQKGVFTPNDPLQVGSPVIDPLQIGLNEVEKPPTVTSHTIPQTVYTIFSCDYQATDISDVEPRLLVPGSVGTPGASAPELAWRPNSSKASEESKETTNIIIEPSDVMLGTTTDSSNGPPGNIIQFPDGPPNEPLQMELSEEHSQDNDDSSYSLEPEVMNDESKRFTCDFCPYANNKRHEFEVHLRTHTGETPFACDMCDKKYIAKKTLNRHKKKHHGDVPFGCRLCDYTTTQKLDMDVHVRIQHNTDGTANDLPCNEFDEGQYEPTPSQLKVSEEQTNDSSPSWSYDTLDAGNKLYTCDICSFETEQKCNFDSHIMEIHNVETLFACEFCDRRYTAKRTVDRHMRECHGEKLFGCGLCDFRTPKKSDLSEHIKTHIKNEVGNDSSDANEMKQSTNDFLEMDLNEVSSYSGPSESSLPANDRLKTEFDETHYEPINDPLQLELSEEHSQDSSLSRGSEADAMGSKNKRFTCETCGYQTNRKYEFTVHSRTHTGEKPYRCGLCDYRSIKRSYVNKHMKTHIKSNPNDRSQIEMNPANHVVIRDSPELIEASELSGPSSSAPTGKTLSGDEHFTCEHCDFRCDDITAWSQHMFEHTKEKTYSCDDCGYKTSLKGSMDLHRKVHADMQSVGSVTITCEFCEYLFTTKVDMSEHIMACHPEKCPHCCDLCDFKAFNLRSLELHKIAHAKPFACNMCDYRAKEECLVASHIEIAHRRAQLFLCSICDYKVDDESQLSKHIMTAHTDVEEYVCYSCDYKASNVKDVEQHISRAHAAAETAPYMSVTTGMPLYKIEAPVTPQPSEQEYLCYACDYKANEVVKVEEHILSAHPAPLAQEVAVPLGTLDSELPGNYLVASPSNHSTPEDFVCYACDYKASTVAQVQQHIQVTHNPPISESTSSPMDVTTEASSSVTPL